MQALSKTEFLSLFDESVHAAIMEQFNRFPDAEAVVCFENLAFDSSNFGARSALVVGPSNTFKSIGECDGKWINDLPSQRQYPVSYLTRAPAQQQE
jgi:hypothetical protein